MVDAINFRTWCDRVGVTLKTGRHWRKLGRIKTVTIYGRHYVTAESSKAFLAGDGRPVRNPQAALEKLEVHTVTGTSTYV